MSEQSRKKLYCGKLAVRGDRPAGVIRAYFSSMDDTDRVEVATLDIRLADSQPDVFRRWVQVLADAHRVALEAVLGVKADGQDVFTLADKN